MGQKKWAPEKERLAAKQQALASAKAPLDVPKEGKPSTRAAPAL